MKKRQDTDRMPVKSLEIEKYIGKWYEIARYDNRFERWMDNVTADYSITKKGKVKVVNSGWKDGKQRNSRGRARQPSPDENPGRLRVSFFPFIYSDYNILLIDKDYSYALVGSKSDKFLWILSRTPELPENIMSEIFTEAGRLGYDTSKLLTVDQDRNR
ncbi:MAG: lipocalin family protein [Bacteroidales bacterium]|nr:lipocalin family protein [Bacteroides sp.]MCM1198580.1 lipocalin family protein [Clostridium sp.]MCM1501292.1 lipocalin family protein [Bacteroidales bacterium]